MSKLYKKYVALKIQDDSALYLFKTGIFYIFLDEDAKLVSSRLNLKLTNLNQDIVKCGFPVSQLEKYTKLINNANLSFKIVDSSKDMIFSPQEYTIDEKVHNLIKKISQTNSDEISISAAFDFISDISEESKLLLEELEYGKE